MSGFSEECKIIAEYIWLGGNDELRSKSRVLNINEDLCDYKKVEIYPKWNYDGSSTNQAKGCDSEIILHPCKVFTDPFETLEFMGYVYVLVLCDTYYPDGVALVNNHRCWANEVFQEKLNEHPWYGIEQEFFITKPSCEYESDVSKNPLGISGSSHQGQYYCSVGSNNAFGRNIVRDAYNMCIHAGVNVSGMNAEVAPGQWEIQVGPCEGIDAGDNLLMCRYILHRVSEKYGVQINFDPKLVKGEWNGSGCHVNYSTEKMRKDGGYEYIINAIEKLGLRHEEHMEWYGEGNEDRMTGEHETASYGKFSFGVANRGASIRIPRQTHKDQKGYLEDRRPASNIDPYIVTAMILKTTTEN